MNIKINIPEHLPLEALALTYLIMPPYGPIPLPPLPGGPEDSVTFGNLQERHIELAKVQPTEKFFEMVRKEVSSCLVEGKKAPVEIAAAIMNISDDLKSGRDPVIRAGDYITLMDYARSKKIV